MSFPRSDPERDRAIADAYRAGALQREVAERFGLSAGQISRILGQQGARKAAGEIAAMRAEHARRVTSDPGHRARASAHTRRLWAEGYPLGRKAIFPDDPVKRADYLNLRRAFGPAYAREAMGVQW